MLLFSDCFGIHPERLLGSGSRDAVHDIQSRSSGLRACPSDFGLGRIALNKNKLHHGKRTPNSLGLNEERGVTRPGSTSSGLQGQLQVSDLGENV